jgi:hypothetical protein
MQERKTEKTKELPWCGLRFLRLSSLQETQSTQVIPWKLRGEESKTKNGARQADFFRRRDAQ